MFKNMAATTRSKSKTQGKAAAAAAPTPLPEADEAEEQACVEEWVNATREESEGAQDQQLGQEDADKGDEMGDAEEQVDAGTVGDAAVRLSPSPTHFSSVRRVRSMRSSCSAQSTRSKLLRRQSGG